MKYIRIREKKTKKTKGMLTGSLLLLAAFAGCGPETGNEARQEQQENTQAISLEEIPEYSGEPYVELENNEPDFTEEQLEDTTSYESYSELDELDRCGTAEANIGQDLMPTQERESISQVKPSGWLNKKYDQIDGGYLYNRCHLIGYQLTGENANEKNLITGTRYMNTEGMLPFENQVADYVEETGNHVLYRVTPVYEGDDLVASGVQMEAESVEDQGEGISFNVYVYNIQPGVEINYTTGDSYWEGEWAVDLSEEQEQTYILNTNTHKYHKPSCPSAEKMKEENKETYTGTGAELQAEGYEPCGSCKP